MSAKLHLALLHALLSFIPPSLGPIDAQCAAGTEHSGFFAVYFLLLLILDYGLLLLLSSLTWSDAECYLLE